MEKRSSDCHKADSSYSTGTRVELIIPIRFQVWEFPNISSGCNMLFREYTCKWMYISYLTKTDMTWLTRPNINWLFLERLTCLKQKEKKKKIKKTAGWEKGFVLLFSCRGQMEKSISTTSSSRLFYLRKRSSFHHHLLAGEQIESPLRPSSQSSNSK